MNNNRLETGRAIANKRCERSLFRKMQQAMWVIAQAKSAGISEELGTYLLRMATDVMYGNFTDSNFPILW